MNGAPSAMVSPGLWGFVAFFVLALALYLLMRNMNARMRRMSYRSEELRKEADATREPKRAPGGEADDAGATGDTGDTGGSEGPGPGGHQGGDVTGEQGQTGETPS